MKQLDDIDKKILARIQGDILLENRPFDAWAHELGMEGHEFIERLNFLKSRGIMREMKAILRHKTAGFPSNAMVVWSVPDQKIEEAGNEIARRDAVSHCYERQGFGEYAIFSMIHGRTDTEVEAAIHEIASSLQITAYKVYWSARELKKSSMEYVREEAG
ncbi:MAG TPA: Lrp/AsnC family transcriptional regulator [Deltaproteobacteria bacterium]|nr:Lrp/AsnC family transcriptional regulator [Deltaproteobacteria bacterium]